MIWILDPMQANLALKKMKENSKGQMSRTTLSLSTQYIE